MSRKNSVQVAIKVRPLLKKVKDKQSLWRIVGNSIQLADSQSEPYYFDHIFDQDDGNGIIFDKLAKQIVHSAIKGFNGTIFAYGQTSSGKTYTMMGDEENPGVMVLAAKEIFDEIKRTRDRQFLLRVGYIEIYNEKIYDLLNKKNQDMKIHETATGIVSVNCEEVIIRSEEDLLDHLEKGNKERTVGETNMNERSSRSHAIFRIIIESRKMDRSEDDAVIQSVLNLVDLAGSERADHTGARGARLKEGGHINKSLLFLSNVIKRLSENEEDKYISFRDSKLTRILQASLGGNALTAIICTIKPNALEETQSTLNFALNAKAIKNKPQVNEIVSDATMMKRLEHEIKVLKTRLHEEQRKNESQIKVRQLEQRIKDEDLKIISCNSLHTRCNREKRRRTWCPSSKNLDASSGGLPTSAILQTSRLQPPKPYIRNTPLITIRQPANDTPPALKTNAALPVTTDNFLEIGEEFAPAELVNFDMTPLHTPHKNEMERNISITPKLIGCVKSTLEKVENDFQELQNFTNLENKVDVQYEPVLTLQQKVETLSQRNAELEKERLDFLRLKSELELKIESLTESHNKLEVLNQRNKELEKDVLNLIPLKHELEIAAESSNRCSQLEAKLSTLTDSFTLANEKISKYEAELAKLKEANVKLEMENREVVNLEFEYKRHKNKAKIRENELVEALNEKEKEISKLEKSLNSLSAACLQNSKEELLQKSLNEEGKADDDASVCIKCIDLQRLLEENKKVTLEFEKLTLLYDSLKLNYDEIETENKANKLKLIDIEEQQKRETSECEKLLTEVQQLKEQLCSLQRNYELLSGENALKQEECLVLTKKIEEARQEMVVVEEKFSKLELSWQEQQQTIKDIESQYATIQTKYEQLQLQYAQLQATNGQTLTDSQRLEKENVDLQAEIVDLKNKVQAAQQRILETNTKDEKAAEETQAFNEDYSSNASNIQQKNEELKSQLHEIQVQFDGLQKEYDVLSNQLMDNLHECECLKKDNIELKERLNYFDINNHCVSKAEDDIKELQLENESKTTENTVSVRGTGVSVEQKEHNSTDSPASKELLKKISELSESLTEIELEHAEGNPKLFKLASTNSTRNKTYKMYLKNILGVHRSQKELDTEIENRHLQGYCTYSFFFVELNSKDKCFEIKNNNVGINGCENVTEYIEKLKEEILELRSLNEQERLHNQSLLGNTERAFSEMREQITQLSAELLEKSMFVENCACKTYQQQIENLQKEKDDITLTCEELQEKINSTLNGSLLANTTLQDVKLTYLDHNIEEVEKLKQGEEESIESNDCQTKAREELTQRCIYAETQLEIARQQLKNQEEQFKESFSRLQLENLQRLEISANEYRDNMKKYNKEWEDRKDEYDHIIQDLNEQLNMLKNTVDAKELADCNMVKEKDELVISLGLLTIKLETVQNELKENEKCMLQVKEEKQQIEEDLHNREKFLTQAKQELLQKLEETNKEFAKLQQEKLDQQLSLRKAKEHESDLRKEISQLMELISNLQIELQKTQNENQELHLQITDLNRDLDKMKDDQQRQIKENAQLKADLETTRDSLNELQVEQQHTQEKYKHYQKLQEEKSKLEATLNSLSKAQVGVLKSLQDEKDQLLKTLQEYEQQHKDFKEREETLQQKVDSLSQQLHEMRIKIDLQETLLVEHEKVEAALTSTTAHNQKLQQEMAKLNKQQESHVSEISNLTSEIDQLNSQLHKQEEEKQTLVQKLSNLKETLENEKSSLQKENIELKSALEEQKSMFSSLKSTNTQLEVLNQQLQQHLNSANEKLMKSIKLQEEFDRLKAEHSGLQLSLKQTAEEAERCSLNLRQDVDHQKALLQKQLEKYNALTIEMENKQKSLSDENFQLSETNKTLTKEKIALEEKLTKITVKNFERGLLYQSTEETSSENMSHKDRLSLERLSNVSLEEKLNTRQQNKHANISRKNRLSIHDERRRQSFWEAVHDKETMTEPADTCCNCVELEQKLKECERDLFIKTGQVTFFSLELEANPLRDENASLIKRLREEQDKHHVELKRYKSKLSEQTLKTEKALATAAYLTAKSAHAELLTEQKMVASPRVVADAEIQTDDDLSVCIQHLRGKYNDLKNICRHRYNIIKELEEKVAQKENSDGNSMSSLEAVEKKQNEALKQELATFKYKYEMAKKVLLSRREEIVNLRAQLEATR